MIGLLMLAAAVTGQGDRPSAVIVDRIEAQALRDPCVQPLSQWWRQYAFKVTYGARGVTLHRNEVAVQMVEASHSLKAGLHITDPQPPMLDDGHYRLVHARYNITSRRFTEWYCGRNWPAGKGLPR